MSDFVELVPVLDTLCSGLAEIENLGYGLLRFYFFVAQGNEHVLVAKLVMPVNAATAWVAQTRLELAQTSGQFSAAF